MLCFFHAHLLHEALYADAADGIQLAVEGALADGQVVADVLVGQNLFVDVQGYVVRQPLDVVPFLAADDVLQLLHLLFSLEALLFVLAQAVDEYGGYDEYNQHDD